MTPADTALPAPTSSTAPMPKGSGAAFWACIVCFVVTVAFWVVWFLVDRNILASDHTPAYYAFENAFPVADGWMAIAALLGAIALRRRRSSALLWLIAASSASLYLAGMDILFDLENGIYKAPLGDWGGVAVEIIINVTTLVGGAWFLAWSWRNRRALLALEGS